MVPFVRENAVCFTLEKGFGIQKELKVTGKKKKEAELIHTYVVDIFIV